MRVTYGPRLVPSIQVWHLLARSQPDEDVEQLHPDPILSLLAPLVQCALDPVDFVAQPAEDQVLLALWARQ